MTGEVVGGLPGLPTPHAEGCWEVLLNTFLPGESLVTHACLGVTALWVEAQKPRV